MKPGFDRRRIVRATTGLALAGASGMLGALGATGAARAKEDERAKAKAEGVTPPEDLMREHGVLNRVLLIYEATLQKFSDNKSFDPAVISGSAQIVREFIERYHERNEELHLFPRFRAAGQMVDLVNVLYQQHQAGRRLTDMILGLAPESARPGDDRQNLIQAMQAFIKMYRPHEAREDTELFPRLRQVVSANELDSMAEDFEKDEHQRFGGDGFAMMVGRVAGLEQAIGIGDLARVTAT
jgi:hemerythrin-like domain-containing protein